MNLGFSITVVAVVLSTQLDCISAVSSCIFPPCRYNINRQPGDLTSIAVRDNTTHSINWQWEVKGGRWDVTYKYTYPGGWYEGTVNFINCSAYRTEKEQAYVSWGYAKNWESNAVLIRAKAWNITYNGDVFGFIPTGNGRYIFRIFTKNKRHNPFANEEIVLPPGSCTLTSSNISQVQKWWSQRKTQRNCPEAVVHYSWWGNNGQWRVIYKWIEENDKTISDVFYKLDKNEQESKVIHWEIDIPKKSVTYSTNPLKILDEKAWILTLNNAESWGFQPTTNEGQWIFRHFSRNLVFYPFVSVSGKMSLS